jgi:hypothetical protein
VGSRSKKFVKETDRAYIAGFLDGDGSLMLQLKRRSDSKRAIRFMATICFYQDTRHEKTLSWIKEVLGIGYISKRKDGMTELRINGYEQIRNILKSLFPHIRFKKLQASALLRACEILSSTKFQKLTQKQLIKLVDLMLVIQGENYITKKKKTKSELHKILGLTP